MPSLTDKGAAGNPLVLITRPEEDAKPLLDAIRSLGMDGLVEPMLRIEPVGDATVELEGCRAVLFTSANGVRAFCRLSDRRDLPAVAVGPASAMAASEAGFEDVESAGGDIHDLIDTVRNRFDTKGGTLYHAAGSVTAGDLKGALEASGFTVRRAHLYNAVPATDLSDACKSALDSGRIAATTFFSPRTASAFVRLLQESGRSPCARTAWAVCLSPNVAEAASAAPWAGYSIAENPDSDAMVAALAAYFDKNEPDRAGIMADDKNTPEDDIVDGTAHDTPVAEPVDDLDTDAVIEAFGGIRPMAAKLGVAVSTVQGWKTRGHIPEGRWRDIIAAAGTHDVDLSVALAPSDASKPDEDSSGDAQEEADSSGLQTEESEDAPIASDSPVSDEPDRPEIPEPVSTPAQGGGKLALLIGVAALVAVVARPLWAPYIDPHIAKLAPRIGITAKSPGALQNSPDTVQALQTELSALRSRIAEIEARPVSTATGTATGTAGETTGGGTVVPADLSGRLAALESDLDGLSDAVETMQTARDEIMAALDETRTTVEASLERDEDTRNRVIERLGVIESLTKQVSDEAERAMAGVAGLEASIARNADSIAALERRPAIEGAAQAGMALAVGDIETALAGGRPFEDALGRLTALAQDDPAIVNAAAGLNAAAASGVATRASLLSGFRRDAPTMQAELGKTGGDILTTLFDGARSLVSVRRKGESPDAPPVSRAEAALERGDLTSAVAALTPVRDSSAAVSAWLDGAERRLAAEAALGDLRRAVASGLSGVMEPSDGNGDGA